MLKVAHKARLINGHQWTQSHRYSGELPEIRHQPWVRIGRKTAAINFLAEFVQLLFTDAAFHIGARIDAGGGVPLEINQIATVSICLAMEKMVEAHVIQRGSGCEAGDMSAQFGRILIRIQHNHHRIPAHQRAQAMFQFMVTGRTFFFIKRDRVQIRCVGTEWQIGSGKTCFIDQLANQVVSTFRAFVIQHGFKRIQPLFGFLRVIIW